jgi:type IV pilus assembly protein PilB
MSAIELVDELLHEAFLKRASDIHLESVSQGLRVRLRVDGLMFDHQFFNKELAAQILARIKVLSHLDVAERRMPQDGKFCAAALHGTVDLRISTFPNLYGEKIVIRILERSGGQKNLDEIGFTPEVLKQFKTIIARATGFFIVTGPTGAGKTTTLYGALSYLNHPTKNISTLEDPVEYNIDGITQSQIHPDIGFTFDRGIRSLLRQDPDIIMVGEIRDRETAEVAIQAALTGHMVLSTLHTNDAPSSIIRLLDMGVPPFLINATLSGVLAQRLVRVLCPACRQLVKPTDAEREFLSYIKLPIKQCYRSVGCNECEGRGYHGRTGIFELLTMTQSLRELIDSDVAYDDLVKQACRDGMVPLRYDAQQKIEAGITTIEELARVIW